VPLPNLGAVKWRKADNSGDLGMALNGSNHVAMDAIIDFAAGQTFGAFSYPDATTTSKGIVQVDPVGGLEVAAGVASLAATGVVAGTYPKVTVDAKGRVTGGTTLVSDDLPAHPCGNRYPFRSAAVHDPEGGYSHWDAPGVEPDRRREPNADGRQE
jgi:phage-related tail fiber protein